MKEHYVTTEGARLYVREDGRSDAPPLVLSNSMGTDLSMWQPQVEEFAAEFRVIRYDIRGHGRSEPTPAPYDLDLLTRDVIAILDALGIERADFCGLSIGGMVGEMLAIDHPGRMRRVVVANAGLYVPPENVVARIQEVARVGLAGLVDHVVTRWFTDEYVAGHPEQVDELKKSFCANSVDGYTGGMAAVGTLDNRERIRQVSVPILVIGGLRDPATLPERSEQLAASIPGAELVLLDAAHLSNVERPAEFTRAVLDFLAGEPRPR